MQESSGTKNPVVYSTTTPGWNPNGSMPYGRPVIQRVEERVGVYIPPYEAPVDGQAIIPLRLEDVTRSPTFDRVTPAAATQPPVLMQGSVGAVNLKVIIIGGAVLLLGVLLFKGK